MKKALLSPEFYCIFISPFCHGCGDVFRLKEDSGENKRITSLRSGVLNLA